MPDATKRLVLLYKGAKEGRGAWFELAHSAALLKAAAEPDHALIEADQAVLDEIDPNLPKGSIGPDGKPAPLPVMLRASHERLLRMTEAGSKAKPASAGGKPSSPAVPSPWSALVIGSIVLASDSKDDGWWECVVTAIEGNGEVLRLRWRDFPGLAEFSKPISRLGIVSPSGLR